MTGAGTAHVSKEEKTRFGILPATISLQIREPGSALTHFLGLILFSIGAGPLLMKTKLGGSVMTMAGMLVFVAATCLLYTASTVYHTVVVDLKTTTLFRKFDHMSISVMIAGTYTPICLGVLPSPEGHRLLAAIWVLAIGGICLKLFWVTCPKWLSSVVYVLMGWLCVFSFGTLRAALPVGAIALLVAGGLAYTVGAVIYAMHPEKFDEKHIYFGSHEIFHVFIMIGTLFHYLVMYCYVAIP